MYWWLCWMGPVQSTYLGTKLNNLFVLLFATVFVVLANKCCSSHDVQACFALSSQVTVISYLLLVNKMYVL